jgi:shikimate kinase
MSGMPKKNIVLIGLMGAGKTTIGRRLAQRIQWPLVDTDHWIEERCGTSVANIFEVEGEAGFRARESKALAEIMATPGQIVTTGGGAPVQTANRPLIAQGFVVYLQAQPRQLWQRLRHDASRPLLTQSDDPRTTLETLYEARDPVYRELATVIVPSSQGSPSQVVSQVIGHLLTAGLISNASGEVYHDTDSTSHAPGP